MGPRLPPLPSSSVAAAEAMARRWKQARVLSALAAWLVPRWVGGRVRVAAWKARWPQPLPPTLLLLFGDGLGVRGGGQQRVWSAVGDSFVSNGSVGDSGSAHGR
jgi:hypothetical protein